MRSIIALLVLNWSGQLLLRGTLPAFAPVALFAREAYLYVGSPVDRWSMRSRCLMFLLSLRPGLRVIAASRYTELLIKEKTLFRRVLVSYAKIACPTDASLSNQNASLSMNSIGLAVLGLDDPTKGSRQRVEFFDYVKSRFQVSVEVYGSYSSSSSEAELYADHGSLSVNGFVENPFSHFYKKHSDKPCFYLGFSLYEGLHMAVVDAARIGLPSLLSDIPAHRELERIAGAPLLIGKDLPEVLTVFNSTISSRSSYSLARSTALKMANRFANIANSAEAFSS